MNKYNFLDYREDGLYKDMYAIELEVGKKYFENNFNGFSKYSESSNIYEFTHLHNKTIEEIQSVYEKVSTHYRDKFPMGSCKRLSGGVHFHIFNGNFRELNCKDLNLKLLNCPLFGKIKGQKIYMRYFSNRVNFNGGSMGTDNKSSAVSYKSNYNTHHTRFTKKSIEFRCNNVIDRRLYGYYVGIMIATKEGVKFKKTTEKLRDYCRVGNTTSFTEMDDISLNDLYGHRLQEEDYEAIKTNTKRIIKLLETNGLTESARALLEYVNELGFELNIRISYRDSFSGEKIFDYISLECVKLFRVDHKGLKFKNKENFYLYIEKIIKQKLLDANIPQALVPIKREEIVKKYSHYLIPNSSTIVPEQTTLIN